MFRTSFEIIQIKEIPNMHPCTWLHHWFPLQSHISEQRSPYMFFGHRVVQFLTKCSFWTFYDKYHNLIILHFEGLSLHITVPIRPNLTPEQTPIKPRGTFGVFLNLSPLRVYFEIKLFVYCVQKFYWVHNKLKAHIYIILYI